MPVETETRTPTRGEMLRKSNEVKRSALALGHVRLSPRPTSVLLSTYQSSEYSPDEVIGETGDNIYSKNQKKREGSILMPRNKPITVADARRYYNQFRIEEIPIYKVVKKKEEGKDTAAG